MRLTLTVSSAAFAIVLALFFFLPLAHAGERRCGEASWYAYTGHRTATGEIFDGSGLTAASPYLPLNSVAIVQNVRNGQSVRVRINDRGPYADGRIIDLSRAAAGRIGLIERGHGPVCVEPVP